MRVRLFRGWRLVMSNQCEFYLERAAEAGALASTSTLDNVRDRWLQSEASWAEMATRNERSEHMRAELIAEKAAERVALKTAT